MFSLDPSPDILAVHGVPGAPVTVAGPVLPGCAQHGGGVLVGDLNRFNDDIKHDDDDEDSNDVPH